MNWETWSVFVVMETVLCADAWTGRPACAAHKRWRTALASPVFASLGILAANAFYFLLSATGVGAVLAASHHLFMAIKWMGAAYLIYLGVSSFFGKHSIVPMPETAVPEMSNRRTFANGFILQVANPKALLFSRRCCRSSSTLANRWRCRWRYSGVTSLRPGIFHPARLRHLGGHSFRNRSSAALRHRYQPHRRGAAGRGWSRAGGSRSLIK